MIESISYMAISARDHFKGKTTNQAEISTKGDDISKYLSLLMNFKSAAWAQIFCVTG